MGSTAARAAATHRPATALCQFGLFFLMFFINGRSQVEGRQVSRRSRNRHLQPIQTCPRHRFSSGNSSATWTWTAVLAVLAVLIAGDALAASQLQVATFGSWTISTKTLG